MLTLIGGVFLAAGCNTYDEPRTTTYDTGTPYPGSVVSRPSTYPSTTTTRPPVPSTTSSYPSTRSYPTTTTPSYPPPASTTTPGNYASAADIALANQVRDQFNRYGDLATASQNIQVTAKNGTITLSGYVPSQREKQLVEVLARNTQGVASVNDQLRISPTTPAPVTTTTTSSTSTSAYNQTDQALAANLEQALSRHPTLGGFAPNIRVHVQNGRVTLTGNVPSEQDRLLVDEVVRNTPGVLTVVDQLQIAALPTGRVDPNNTRVYPTTAAEMFNLHVEGLSDPDRTLAQRILDALRTDTSIPMPSQPVNIYISNGQVALEGGVQTQDQKRNIAAAVQRAAGANIVYDNLQIVKTP